MSTIARAVAVVGSLYGLLRNRLGLNVATPLAAQELSCTVAPDRRLVVLGHEPIAGFARDHGTVADQAAMLALHTLDSTTLLTEPRFVAVGDSCLRADDPGWRWHCIAGHGQSLSDWERRPLGGALSGLATSGHTHTAADIADATAIGRALMALATPASPKIARLNSDGTVTAIDVPGAGADLGDMLVLDWRLRVERAGGTLTASSAALAAALVSALRAAGIIGHIMRLDAWLGADLAAATTPLIDRLSRGAVLVGVLSSAFSEGTGMEFGGSSYIRTGYTPASLSPATLNGGIGWWEAVATAAGNVEPYGCSDNGDNRYVLDIRSAFEAFRWGNAANYAQTTGARQAAHYYGQRSSATSRVLYRDGVAVASNTASDGAAGNTVELALGGANYAGTYYPWTGRCKVAYLTDGGLTTDEVEALHSILADLIAATGR